MKEIKAHLRFLRMAPRKVRVVANSIKGKSVKEAESTLKFLGRRPKLPLEKLLKSAISNAKHNFNIESSGLFVKDIRVDVGPTLKRRLPRARGMATPIKKRSSHITIVLADESVKTKNQKPK